MMSHPPLYAQAEDALVARISTGELAVGTQLPSEEELSREFSVSRTTVRTTIQNLVRRGLVEIRRGRGHSYLHRRWFRS
jgi:GntR family transcriptional regulator